jgi:GNAT superfamily N-acetyltransferase
MLTREEILARQRPGHRAFYSLFHEASPGASVVVRDDGVMVCRVPARPERSLVNAVLYEDAGAMVRALPALREELGDDVTWTVWVAPGDEAVAAACAAAGHVLDATPELMYASIDDIVPRSWGPSVPLDTTPSWRLMGDVNDAAFGLPPEHLSIAFDRADPSVGWRAVAVHPGSGNPLACAGAVVAGETAEVVMVATLPDARGRGLAAQCMRSCLARARDEGGARWTTLEATKMGEPLYAHMGYARAGAYGMWERRPGVS